MHVQYMYNRNSFMNVLSEGKSYQSVHLIDVYEIYEMSNII